MEWMIFAIAGIIIMIMIGSFLVFTLWHQPGESIKHHVNRTLTISHCTGNQTGKQATEGNVTGNPTMACK